MGDNGDKKDVQEEQEIKLITVTLKNGSMGVDICKTCNIALISHAVRLASLSLDNELIKLETQKMKEARSIITRLRR